MTSDILNEDKNNDIDSIVNNPESSTIPQPQPQPSEPSYTTRWHCWKIQNLDPCDYKSPTHCLMHDFVRQWRELEELTTS